MKRFAVWTLLVYIAVTAFGDGRAGLAQLPDELQPVPIRGASGRSVQDNTWWAWWAWTASATGPIIFDAQGSAAGTVMNVFHDGSSVASNRDPSNTTLSSEVRFTAQQGRIYDITMANPDSAGRQTYVLNWRSSSAGSTTGSGGKAAADDFDSSAAISGASGRRVGSSVGAGIESGEPNHARASGGASVWWTWTAPATGEATFDTHGSNFDTLLAVYTGTSLNRLTEVASNDDASGSHQSEVRFTAERGLAYHVAVDGHGGASGSIELNWWLASTDASPEAALREQVFDDAGTTVYVVAGNNASLRYRMDESGVVAQSLYESAAGTERVRTFHDEVTGAPRAVLNEVSGHWLVIQGGAPGRVDFTAYDGRANYLGGFAIYEKSGQYFTGDFDGAPAAGPTADVEDGLTNVQAVPPEAATLIDMVSGAVPVAPGTPSVRRADAEALSLHRGLTRGGLEYVNRGMRLLRKPGALAAGAHLATAGASAFFAAQFLPDIANGIRTTFGRDCPPAGSVEGRLCADLTNMAADTLSRQGTGPIGYLRHAVDWIRDSPSHLRNWIARGATHLKNIIAGLLPGDTVRDQANAVPAASDQSQYVGKNCDLYKKNPYCYKKDCYKKYCYKKYCYKKYCYGNDPACWSRSESEYNSCKIRSDSEYKTCTTISDREHNACLAKSDSEYNSCVGERYLACKEANNRRR